MEEPLLGEDYIHMMAWYFTDASKKLRGENEEHPANKSEDGE